MAAAVSRSMRTENLVIRVEPILKQRLEAASQAQDRSVSSYISVAPAGRSPHRGSAR
jgi:hypothetical protein